jgi:hypothetical protein
MATMGLPRGMDSADALMKGKSRKNQPGTMVCSGLVGLSRSGCAAVGYS